MIEHDFNVRFKKQRYKPTRRLDRQFCRFVFEKKRNLIKTV